MHGDTLIWGPWRGPVQFYLGSHQPGTQGIEDVDTPGPQFSLSPNPASGTVTVETAEGAEMVEIVDMAGCVVHSQATPHSAPQPLTLDISALPSGVYLVRLSTPQGSALRKLIVTE